MSYVDEPYVDVGETVALDEDASALPDEWSLVRFEDVKLPIPVLGRLVDVADAEDTARALADVRQAEEQLAEVKRVLVDRLIAERVHRGEGTIRFDSGVVVEVSKPEETVYDADAIEADLRAAGMPEDRISAIVRETVERKVMAGEAKKAASANPDYAAIIDRHRRIVEKRPSPKVSIPGAPS